MSFFWSTVVTIVILLNIIGGYLLIRWVAKPNKGEAKEGEVTGHVWDDDLRELNNPMPRWWLYMFYIGIVWGLIYLLMYPGFANYPGLLGWTAEKKYNDEVIEANEIYGPVFSKYAETPLVELSKNKEANLVGQRLFVNYCAQCHGSDAGGSRGYPNLTDNDWIWGGSPDDIKYTITKGRNAVMAAWGPILKPIEIEYLAEHVMSLSGRKHKATDAQRGKELFANYCAVCHQADGTGNPLLGAPNLADKVWLYGASRNKIIETITYGRKGHMPAHLEFLGEDKVHILAAYVYSLSNK